MQVCFICMQHKLICHYVRFEAGTVMFWGFIYSGMWHCVPRLEFPEVLKEHISFTFKKNFWTLNTASHPRRSVCFTVIISFITRSTNISTNVPVCNKLLAYTACISHSVCVALSYPYAYDHKDAQPEWLSVPNSNRTPLTRQHYKPKIMGGLAEVQNCHNTGITFTPQNSPFTDTHFNCISTRSVWRANTKLSLPSPRGHTGGTALWLHSSLTSVLHADGQLQGSGHFTPGKETQYPLTIRLAGPLSWSWQFGEETDPLPLLGFDHRIVQPVA